MSELASPTAKYGDQPCSEGGCPNQTGTWCEYVDRKGRKCATAWCPQHQYIAGRGVYCRRHAGVMVALLSLPPDERDFPDVDNRASSLVQFMARRLHSATVQLLQALAKDYPGATIAADGLHITLSGVPRVRGWEFKWRLLDNTGPLATLAIRVDEELDSLVQARVDGTIIHQAVPPWITERVAASPEEDVARRQAFDQELLSAMWQALSLHHQKNY